jgi:glutamyl-tRNA reductase
MLDTLVVVGVNHDSAPVTLRERIAFAPEKVHESLGALIRDTQLSEAVICRPAIAPSYTASCQPTPMG